ncbi:MAG TPA: BON domain-containing protein [Gaiellaceae bacterium]|nr:BON domain-containing protein [Gaiellaceae bacterium]HET8653026.1 BON domain-containing protein [Gaiellaceae bacterium]
MKKLLGLIGLAAAVTYFFHPNEGQRRRAKVAGQVRGLITRAEEGPKQQPDDVTLTHMVESELFRDEEVPKGQINVNAENGKIVLRGEVGKPEMIRDLEERARSVQGVRDVENLLHVPGTKAPMHE